MEPQRKVKIKWSPNFAYAIGLLATDGCLSKDGRHLDLTSKDDEQLKNFLYCLGIKNKIGIKYSGTKKAHARIQFGDIVFYRFLIGIGLSPQKSKTLGKIDIPSKYFFDFLRGCFDGDGTFYSYYDPRWKRSFMFYTAFISSSKKFIDWIRSELLRHIKVWGHITHDRRKSTYQLKYAKKESITIIRKMYYRADIVYLARKRLKIKNTLAIIGLSL